MKNKQNNIVSVLIIILSWITALALFYIVARKFIQLLPSLVH